MNILELDEAQGLTGDMVRSWLNRNTEAWFFRDRIDGGSKDHAAMWTSRDGRHGVLEFWLTGGDGSQYWSEPGDVAKAVESILKSSALSPQALLREINPRLRKGLPSEAAREAHEGHNGRWIASRRDEYTHTMIVRFLRGMKVVKLQFEDHRPTFDPTEEIEKWSFWPCDAHGNKVRHPEKDGVML